MNKDAIRQTIEIIVVMAIVAFFHYFMAKDSGEYKSRPPTPPESLYQPKNVMWRR